MPANITHEDELFLGRIGATAMDRDSVPLEHYRKVLADLCEAQEQRDRYRRILGEVQILANLQRRRIGTLAGCLLIVGGLGVVGWVLWFVKVFHGGTAR